MEFHKGGRFGRITKSMIDKGFEADLEKVLFDSMNFSKMNKNQSVKYVETVINRMDNHLGKENTKKILSKCGERCCGKTWSNFVREIKDSTEDLVSFFQLLNQKEAAFNTVFDFDQDKNIITINRGKCICGLINKAKNKFNSNLYCQCSTGHFFRFFEPVFPVKNVELKKSILSGADSCEWEVKIEAKKSTL